MMKKIGSWFRAIGARLFGRRLRAERPRNVYRFTAPGADELVKAFAAATEAARKMADKTPAVITS